jgi:hypothetical protein
MVGHLGGFAHLTWCGSTSLPLALKMSSFALAGPIPTEFGKLVNLGELLSTATN